VSVSVEHLREFRVQPSAAVLQESLRRGLVLYYSFDEDPRKTK
jgi:hypothetical protein